MYIYYYESCFEWHGKSLFILKYVNTFIVSTHLSWKNIILFAQHFFLFCFFVCKKMKHNYSKQWTEIILLWNLMENCCGVMSWLSFNIENGVYLECWKLNLRQEVSAFILKLFLAKESKSPDRWTRETWC